jgi:hypothetical protein
VPPGALFTIITARTLAHIGDEIAHHALPPSSPGKEQCMQMRRRFKQTVSLEERLSQEARELREVANSLAAGPARDDVMRKTQRNEAAAYLTAWRTSPGLKPPT